MKAVRIHQHGGPEVLVYEDVPEPQIKANQVLVRVRACALNHLDLFVRGGIPGMKFPMPHILGSDIAGEVVEVGELCERVKPGWRVLLSPGLSCRQCEQCLLGNDNFCRRYTLFGYGIDGGNAELLAAPEYSAIQIPDDLSFEEAAAVPLVFLTAWHMLMARAKLQPGEDVLVLAASSGVGSAAIQIAKLFQCRVIATAGGEAKLRQARRAGRRPRDRSLPAGHLRRSRNASPASAAWTWWSSTWAWPPGPRAWNRSRRRPAGDLRRHHRFRRALGSALPVQQAVDAAGLVHGHHGRAAPGAEIRLPQAAQAGDRPRLSAAEIRAAHERLENKEQFGKVVVTL